MMYLKWAAIGPLSLFMAVLGRVLAPVLPFFVQDDGYLPRWLWWFQTPDNTCDGDRGHWERHPGTGRWATYGRRTAWFWRNVGYGFDIDVLGLKAKDGDTLTFSGVEGVGTNPSKNGYEWRVLRRADGTRAGFQLYAVYVWPFWKTRCLRMNFGWKIWNFGEGLEAYQWTGMANPFFGCTVVE